jgi:hypothetical protein
VNYEREIVKINMALSKVPELLRFARANAAVLRDYYKLDMDDEVRSAVEKLIGAMGEFEGNIISYSTRAVKKKDELAKQKMDEFRARVLNNIKNKGVKNG